MARHLRLQFPGAIYHVTIRGNGRQSIFADDRDRERFLERLADSVETYRVRLYLFCLMTNHVHLVIETPSGNLSRFMQSLETGYTVYYNLRHRTVGHVLQGRYNAKVVDGDEYLLKLSRYVHLNPVHVDGVKKKPFKEKVEYLRRYAWSSYPGYIGVCRKLNYVAYGPILTHAGVKKRWRQREYRQFVEEGLADTDTDFLSALKGSRRSIGGEDFRRWVDELYGELAEKKGHPEDVELRRETAWLVSDEILKVTGKRLGVPVEAFRIRRRDSILRPIAGMMLMKYGGMTQRGAAKELGIKSGGLVGRSVRRLKTVAGEECKVAKLLAGIEEDLSQKLRESVGVKHT
ncbi:MAG: transposase [Verrucomicrobiota bacterium]